jgi:hypothetical protein
MQVAGLFKRVISGGWIAESLKTAGRLALAPDCMEQSFGGAPVIAWGVGGCIQSSLSVDMRKMGCVLGSHEGVVRSSMSLAFCNCWCR